MHTNFSFNSKGNRQKRASQPLKYLALGDSYTIGEGVDEAESFPHQLVTRLLDGSLKFFPPTVLARTGWTIQELQMGIKQAPISNEKFDLLTVLIGVNNQYRGDNMNTFRNEFPLLLDRALAFAEEDSSRIISISIPDWGVTPYAIEENGNMEKIAEEIDQYNQVIQNVSIQKGVNFLDITQEYRKIGGLAISLTADQLHPSGYIYKKWAKELALLFQSKMNFG